MLNKISYKHLTVFLITFIISALPVGAFCADYDSYIVTLINADEGLSCGADIEYLGGDMYLVSDVTEEMLSTDPNVSLYEKDAEVIIPDTPDTINITEDEEVSAAELPQPGEYSGYSRVSAASSGTETDSVAANTILPIPSDTYYSYLWNRALTNADMVRFLGTGDNDVKIGIIDSGSASKHPDISCISQEVNFATVKVNGVLKNADVYDNYGHSTFISGIIGADIDNGIGVAGILPNASIVSLKVMEGSSGTISTIVKAINYAVSTCGCDVLNLSFTSTTGSSMLKSAVENAVSKGVILVAASGNLGTGETGTELLYPAAYDGVIGVGSVNRYEEHASSSHYNSSVDACAPGVMLYSSYYMSSSSTYSYSYGSGTSYAAPHVTAAAALAKSYDKNIDADGFMELLEKTCRHLGDEGKNDEYGYGIVDFAAIESYYGAEYGSVVTDFDLTKNSSAMSGTVTLRNFTDTAISGDVYIAAYQEVGDDDNSDDISEVMTDCEVIDDVTIDSGGRCKISSLSLDIEDRSKDAIVRVFMLDDNLSPVFINVAISE